MNLATVRRWNLSPTEWSSVLLDEATPVTVANHLKNGKFLPWTETLLQLTRDSETVLDLGSGRGEHSAILARNGKQTMLVDWSKQNLEFSTHLFQNMGLRGEFLEADITAPLPFAEESFDAVFCCGILEFFPDDSIRAVLREALRVSKKRLIVMVPNAFSLPYRIGKWYMERARTWIWTGESPFYTFKPYLRSFSNVRVFEYSVAAKHSLKFLQMPIGRKIAEGLIRFLRLQDEGRQAALRQGYLLVTVAEKIRR